MTLQLSRPWLPSPLGGTGTLDQGIGPGIGLGRIEIVAGARPLKSLMNRTVKSGCFRIRTVMYIDFVVIDGFVDMGSGFGCGII